MCSLRPIILASTSPYRLEMLTKAGVDCLPLAPRCDEETDIESPRERALELARRKALSLVAEAGEAVIIGGDQVASVEGTRVGKAKSAEEARGRLEAMSGRWMDLYSATAVVDGPTQRIIASIGHSRVLFRPLTPREIDAYVALGEWKGSAGCFKIEGRGAQLAAAIEGDVFTILGLPLIETLQALRELGALGVA